MLFKVYLLFESLHTGNIILNLSLLYINEFQQIQVFAKTSLLARGLFTHHVTKLLLANYLRITCKSLVSHSNKNMYIK